YFTGDATVQEQTAAQKALETAMRLQPELAEVQMAHAWYQYWVTRDFEAARVSFEKVYSNLPNNADVVEALGTINAQLGRWQDSSTYFNVAIGLNPRNRGLRVEATWVPIARRDFDAARKSFDEALQIWPDDTIFIALEAWLYQSLGELDEADRLLVKLHGDEDFPTVSTTCRQAI